MEQAVDDKITYQEYATDVAKILREKGYDIADPICIRKEEPDKDVVGILKPRNPIQKSFLGIKWNKKQRALYIGTLWLENQPRGARFDENWVLEVYGRDQIPELTEVVGELSRKYQINVQTRLVAEEPCVEKYSSDVMNNPGYWD